MPLKLFPPGTRKGSRWYVARGYIAGKRYEYTCRDEHGNPTADRRKARAFLRELESDRREAQRQRRRPAGAPRTFGAAVEAYVAARGPSRNDRHYLAGLKAELGDLPLGAVTRDDILSAGRALYPGTRAETINRQAIAPGAAVLHYAADNDWCGWRRIRRLPEREPETRRPAKGVIERLIASTQGRERLLLMFLALQGTRISETLGLKAEHVDLGRGEFRLYVSKAGRWKTLPLHRDLVAEMANLGPLEDRRWFPWGDRRTVYRWLRPLAKRLGVRFTPHMARHEFGGRLREAGATARDLVDAGSWTNEKSTRRYTDAPLEHAREILHRTGGTRGGKEPV